MDFGLILCFFKCIFTIRQQTLLVCYIHAMATFLHFSAFAIGYFCLYLVPVPVRRVELCVQSYFSQALNHQLMCGVKSTKQL